MRALVMSAERPTTQQMSKVKPCTGSQSAERCENIEGGGDARLNAKPMFACECSLMLWASA